VPGGDRGVILVQKHRGAIVRIFVLLLAALLSQVARADLFTAQLAYKKGDYEAAAKDYRSMAELGNPIAQYDLAALYLNGQGVKRSELNAYAWASLAASNGNAQAKGLADRLRPNLAPGSEKIAQDPGRSKRGSLQIPDLPPCGIPG
jgi:hypothetical protein